ncbi:oligosaccharide flippase family protein [Paenibacillus sediminis]|uniref:O-antigen/teichoic acid export membrane protein n=1 Tax=Paenibacillus sediminis TaxID=664909 RepID=A0ABS4H4B2_9BACL|nr:oligosaccharide flippase family protein [Paenibacillus sediminis]MBP1937383.1 O-antigen/teichoic acid export membrane protein [Paenibacillus sediminis]
MELKIKIPTTTSSESKMISGGIWTFCGRVVFAFSVLVINVLLSRMLSSTDYGTYLLAFNIAFFGSIVGVLGLNQAIIKFTTENLQLKQYSSVKQAIKLSIRIALMGSISAMVLYLILQQSVLKYFFNSPQLSHVSILTGAWIVMNIFQQFLGETFRGLHGMKAAVIFGGVFSNLLFIISVAIYTLVSSQTISLFAFMLMINLTILINCLLACWFLHLKLKQFPLTEFMPKYKEIRLRSILNVSIPIMLSNVALFFLTSSDLWMLGIAHNEEQVAIYGSAVRLIATINFFGIILNSMMSTVISDKNAAGKLKELEKTGRVITTILTIPAIFLVFIFALFGRQILGIVFGSFYSQGGLILFILSIGQVINLLVGPSGLILTLTGNEKVMLRITVISSLLTMSCGAITAINGGPTSLALVMVGGLAFQNLLMWIATKRRLGISTHFSFLLIVKWVKAIVKYIHLRLGKKTKSKKSRETVLNE